MEQEKFIVANDDAGMPHALRLESVEGVHCEREGLRFAVVVDTLSAESYVVASHLSKQRALDVVGALLDWMGWRPGLRFDVVRDVDAWCRQKQQLDGAGTLERPRRRRA